ncbi:hypothetical protein [Planctomyces sp. SH-PL62]|uniref:hypothetical protein n=1 Tax=Planctomyces sp. SH-PL62 TaxID=1636152 RepID=UPI00078B4310|nr:hypothetical protein [Planctomyces sp. SH-PL62]AMV40105.1 hypothetical protein VT85_21915 [Planctomyces sp. SH-PL62]
METPLIRPGDVPSPETPLQLVVHFFNAAEGNLATQTLMTLGIPGDRIGVVDPERMERKRGMILAVGCPDEAARARAEDVCRKLGGEVHRWRG